MTDTTTESVAALPIETAPRDGTMLRLLVDYTDEGENPLEDAYQAWTIGFNQLSDTGVDVWEFAGWSWEQDCFTAGIGRVIGWLPFHSSSRGLVANQTPDSFTNADSCQPTRTYADGIRDAAAVAAEYVCLSATECSYHDAGWDSAAMCIEIAIIDLIRDKVMSDQENEMETKMDFGDSIRAPRDLAASQTPDSFANPLSESKRKRLTEWLSETTIPVGDPASETETVYRQRHFWIMPESEFGLIVCEHCGLYFSYLNHKVHDLNYCGEIK